MTLDDEVAPGRNLRPAGDDVNAGETVLTAGTRMGAAEIGIAVVAGRGTVSCARRPRVVILATGDELVAPGGPLGPGQLHNSNAATLAALATQAGARVLRTDTVGDTEEATRAAIGAALEEADVLVLSGGVSVGPHDHVKPALQALGVDEVFWRVALRPGRPTWFGTPRRRARLRPSRQPGLGDGHLHALRPPGARGDAGRARTSPSGSSATSTRPSRATPTATSACA